MVRDRGRELLTFQNTARPRLTSCTSALMSTESTRSSYVFVQPHTTILRPASSVGVVHNVLIIRVGIDREVPLDQISRFVCGKPEQYVDPIHISRVEPNWMTCLRGLKFSLAWIKWNIYLPHHDIARNHSSSILSVCILPIQEVW